MRLRNIQESGIHRRVKRKVQRRRADTAGQRAAQRFLQVAAAERQKALGIGKEKPGGKFVLAAAEFAVPVGCELVVGIFSRPADGERARCRVAARNQQSVGRPAELVALKIQQLQHHRIDRGRRIPEKSLRNRSLYSDIRKRRDRRADERARGIAAALPRALVIHEKVPELLLYHRSAKASAEDVLNNFGTCQTLAIQEEVVGIQNRVPEIFVSVAMELSCAGL